ncbi:MAG: helix-hairpin-helix domain-containing protein, partial [Bacteroidetes bacterium]
MKKISKKVILFFQENFGYDNREIRGFFALLIGMLLMLIVPFLVDFFWTSHKKIHNTEKLNEIIAQLVQNDSTDEQYATYIPYPKYQKKYYPKKNKKTTQNTNIPKELFEFDPNQISIEQWEKLGLRNKIAQNIRKYIEKGGKFRTKESLKKVYGFPEELFEELEPYINIPTEEKTENIAEKKSKKENIIEIFDLNTADTTTLMQIRGVGLKTAQSIIKFRDKIGGFSSLDQLNEVYILKNRPEVVEEIKKYAKINEKIIKKVKL